MGNPLVNWIDCVKTTFMRFIAASVDSFALVMLTTR